MRAYPQIDVQVDLQDRPVNLQEDGYDIAIRTGTLSNSTLIAKRLAPDRHIIAASPAYLARKGRPTQPEDLARHDCLILGDRVQWPFSKNGLETSVRIQGPIRSNDGELLCQAAQDGLGLIRASELVVLAELRSGRLTQVLADYEVGNNAAVWALYPSSKHLLPRMRALLDFLGAWFRDLTSGQTGAPLLATSSLGAAVNGRPQAPVG